MATVLSVEGCPSVFSVVLPSPPHPPPTTPTPDLIKLQGDWNSNAYERYLQPSFGLCQDVAYKLGLAAEKLSQCKKFLDCWKIGRSLLSTLYLLIEWTDFSQTYKYIIGRGKNAG